jgi:hypothetical protein
MKVTLNPYRLRIQPEMVNGHIKYAPKYAADRPVTFAGVISSKVRKWEFKTSRRPYAKPHRKNKMVTVCYQYLFFTELLHHAFIALHIPNPHGISDCLRVRPAPSVIALSSTTIFRL